MTSIEELKKKQPELKSSLQELVDFINSEHYFNLTSSEKSLVSQYRAGLEITLNAVTNITYGDMFTYDNNGSLMLPLLMGMMSNPWGPSKGVEELKKELEEKEYDIHQELTDHAV